MKHVTKLSGSWGPARTLLLFGALALGAPCPASDDTNTFQLHEYAWSAIGVSVIPEFNATLSSLSQGSTFSEDWSLKLSPGFAVHGGLGQRFLPWLSAEMESGFYYNDVDEVRFAGGVTRSFNSTLMQVPILVNVMVHLPDKHRFVPFAGAGVGARLTWLDIEDSVSLGDAGVVRLNESSTEASLAYQAFAGLRLNVRPDSTIAVTYRFNGAISPNWSLKDAYTGASVANLKAKDIYGHTLELAFSIRF